ncbi:MAG: homoserine O-acetyltransferase [Candidatus Omnitrophica bacterium]|nr:homoserine O-acetyltransferase [Candidatus Omnitrophota bacterium]
MPNDLGIIKTQSFTLTDELTLKSGEKLGPVTLAYETYGELNRDKSNAILILHALSGDAHAAGWHDGDKKPGWWDNMIGAGKAFDTNKYFIISSNVIGGCKGSTGPSSINPKTGKPYGLSFPVVTVEDMVNAQKKLIDHLRISKLLSVAGGSMGGMQVLQWTVSFPEMVRSAIVIAASVTHTAQQIAFHEVGRQAIMADPDWQCGNYYGKAVPARGLSVARMIGHITYMSKQSMEEKFGRKLKSDGNLKYDFSSDFEVEGYLRHQGDSFVQRFDANSWLYITKALDYFNLAQEENLVSVLSRTKSSFLVISFTSDWLYPSYQSKEIVKALKISGKDVTDIEINSSYGHDAFLVEVEGQSKIIPPYLERISK